MRTIAFIVAAAALFAAVPAHAQTSITIQANPIPIVDATINNQPVRLEVDLRLPDWLVLNGPAADRLHVQRLPFMAVRVGLQGEPATLRGRMARPRIVFEGGQVSRAFAGIFALPVTTRADGVIGPGAIPHDVITIVLGPEPAGARDIVLPLEDPDIWTSHTSVGGLDLRLVLNLANNETFFNVTAAQRFDAQGLVVSDGALVMREVILGLSGHVQPVRTELTALGFPLAPGFARTTEPLQGATEEEAIVVTPQAPPPPALALGRSALAHCSSISVNRLTRQLTLRCAA